MDGVEIEIKIRIDALPELQERLMAMGARMLHERGFEDNLVLDYPDLRLRCAGKLIRLRRYRDEQTLTYKGPATFQENVKSRVETEIRLDSLESTQLILAELGLYPVFQYQKFRTVFICDASFAGRAKPGTNGPPEAGLQIMVDETPIGLFLELEGERALILKAAHFLGYGPESFIPQSYRDLYVDYCLEQGRTVGNMVF
jgi:adenylate cyclase, class 2